MRYNLLKSRKDRSRAINARVYRIVASRSVARVACHKTRQAAGPIVHRPSPRDRSIVPRDSAILAEPDPLLPHSFNVTN